MSTEIKAGQEGLDAGNRDPVSGVALTSADTRVSRPTRRWSWLKRLLLACGCVGIAVPVGAGSAWWVIGWGAEAEIKNGPWEYNPLVGSVAADPYLRAQVARVGFLALNNSETIYFFATQDSAGNPLRCDQAYRVEGRDVDARWWSITAYAADDFLIPNEQNRYSYNMTNLERNAEGGYTIHVSRSTRPGNWIPTGDGQTFSLWLRLYNPSQAVRDHVRSIELPRIVKENAP
jgi:hypothetical protein